VPDDAKVRKLAQATFDLSEYVVDIARKEGMAPGLQPLAGGVAVHLACHARAQNMGAKAADMLRLIPDTKIDVIERCSGHGGSWGVKQEYFEVALKVGKPAARQAAKAKPAYVASECPLAGEHLIQGMQRLGEAEKAAAPKHATNPIELIDAAYRLSK
ncbi:MAG: heterodisulfide reductase-related iron-sulfur binding cluster, partial [Ferrovibrionaceae bacterium]